MTDSESRDLQPVIDGDWCIGCGACVGVDPSIALMKDDQRGSFRPSHAGNEQAAAVCPAVESDITQMGTHVHPAMRQTAHGAVQKVWLAQNTDEAANLASSSGGVIRPILKHLLSSGSVQGVVALCEVGGLQYEQRLLTDVAEVDRLPGSVYHAVEHSALYSALQEARGRLAVVGIPCQLEGLYKYLGSDPGRRYADKVAVTIGLFCGWQYTDHSMRALSHYLRFNIDEVAAVSYRGGGPVGKTRIRLSGGDERTLNRRVDYAAQVAFDRSFNMQRCHLCVNHSNLLADIAVGDAWLPETVFSRTGVSLLVARNRKAEAIISRVAEGGSIRLAESDVTAIERSQGRSVAFGDSAFAMAAHLRDEGVFVPRITAPNEGSSRAPAREDVARTWHAILAKRGLQQQGRYWALWLRKGTLELPVFFRRLSRSRLLGRYIRAIGPSRRNGASAENSLTGFK